MMYLERMWKEAVCDKVIILEVDLRETKESHKISLNSLHQDRESNPRPSEC
jgi:hypothetical protein